jgi:hypothetical protein
VARFCHQFSENSKTLVFFNVYLSKISPNLGANVINDTKPMEYPLLLTFPNFKPKIRFKIDKKIRHGYCPADNFLKGMINEN